MIKVQAANAKTAADAQQAQHTYLGVALFLISPTGQFLISQRVNALGDSVWALGTGGHVELNEDPLTTIHRETFEEIGIEIPPPTLMGVTSNVFPDSGKHYVTLFYAIRLDDIASIRNLEPGKCSELRWVYYDELPQNILPSLATFVQQLGPNGLRHMLAMFPR